MRKIGFIFMVVFLLSACSLTNILPAPTQVAVAGTPTSLLTPTETATVTPTLPTPTYTSTPTLIGLSPTITETGTPATATETSTPLPLVLDTATPLSLVTVDTPGQGFNSVTISGNQIFWGVCKPGSVTITAEVTEPDQVYNVVVFVRLQDVKSPDTTPWSKGAAMDAHHNGIFTYELKANTVEGRNDYLKAWVLYQLVATDGPGNIIGRTKIYSQSLTIGPCT